LGGEEVRGSARKGSQETDWLLSFDRGSRVRSVRRHCRTVVVEYTNQNLFFLHELRNKIDGKT
jgi:hypothetical protein